MKHLCIFLDRDGTLNIEVSYLSCVKELILPSEVVEGLKYLQILEFSFTALTNQSGVAYGYFSVVQVAVVHAYLIHLLADNGVQLSSIYACFHHARSGCLCRKPSLDLLYTAVKDYWLNLRNGYIIGDRETDIILGQKSGVITILLCTGYGLNILKKENILDFRVNILLDAAHLIKCLQALE